MLASVIDDTGAPAVVLWSNGCGAGLAINGSQVPLGQTPFWVATLGKSFTHSVYLLPSSMTDVYLCKGNDVPTICLEWRRTGLCTYKTTTVR